MSNTIYSVRRVLAFIIIIFMTAGISFGQFNPSNPPEPGRSVRVNVSVSPSNAGYINGLPSGGIVSVGSRVNLSAIPYSSFQFICWEDEYGNVMSESSNYQFVAEDKNVRLTARYKFLPSSPQEPPVPVKYVNVSAGVTPSGAGYTSGSGRYAVGSNLSLYAYNYSGYKFSHWELNGEIISTNYSVNYVVNDGANNPIAVFEFSPNSPGEPSSQIKKYSLNLVSRPDAGARFNLSSGNKYADGELVNILVYNNANYKFLHWENSKGERVSESQSFNFKMPGENETLYAVMQFSPNSPAEPSSPDSKRNVIYGARMDVKAGHRCEYAFYLDNVDVASGATFDLEIPMQLFSDLSLPDISLSPRCEGHSFSIQPIEGNVWRIAIRGTEPLSGASGKLLTIAFDIPEDIEAGSLIPIRLSKGVVILPSGDQLIATTANGLIRVAENDGIVIPGVDFIIKNVNTPNSEINPGENIIINWEVSNDGEMDASGGWNETVSLIDEAGRSLMLATTYFDGDKLKVGERIVRSADLRIPELAGIEGKVNICVALSPYSSSGEDADRQINNIAYSSGYPLFLNKFLKLELPDIVEEGSNNSVNCTLSRSGSWSNSETFRVSLLKGDSRIVLPSMLIIPRDMSSIYFSIPVVDNDILDEDSLFSILIEGNDYPVVTREFEIIDNEYPEIQLFFANDELKEGENSKLNIYLPVPASEDISLILSTDRPNRLSFPSQLILQKGESEATIIVEANDNLIVDGDQEATIFVKAEGYLTGEEYITIRDNDIPRLEMILSPSMISENAGMSGCRGTIRRLNNFDQKVTINLSDDSAGDLIFPVSTITLSSGEESRDFIIGIVDNNRVEGDRRVNVTASVFISSCGCSSSVESGGVVTCPIDIIDDDGASISLSLQRPTLTPEEPATILKISRNTPAIAPLSVTLSSEQKHLFDKFPESVIIPIGEDFTTIELVISEDTFINDETIITIVAGAEGHSKGGTFLLATDRKMPDLVMKALSTDKDSYRPGESATFLCEIANEGRAVAPDAAEINLYFASEIFATAYTTEALQPGMTSQVALTGKIPLIPGYYNVSAIINENNSIAELTHINNVGNSFEIEVTSPLQSASLIVDKRVYNSDEDVNFNGVVNGYAGELELFIIKNGIRISQSVSPDSNGNFTTKWTPLKGGGDYKAGICVPGENSSNTLVDFIVKGFSVTSGLFIEANLVEGSLLNGDIVLSNGCSEALSNINVESVNVPSGCQLTIGEIDVIPANGKISISYSIFADSPTSGDDWETFDIIIKDVSSSEQRVKVYFYCRPAGAELIASVSKIQTTMSPEGSLYKFSITNIGAAPTGEITLALPSFMKPISLSSIPSLGKDQSHEILLTLTPSSDMQYNVPVKGRIGINCAGGNGLAIPYEVEPVANRQGNLIIDVKDEYSFVTAEAPHVAGAEVVVLHPVSGKVIASGMTDDSGLWSAAIPEGFYSLKVNAPRHDSYNASISISPGCDNVKPIFIPFRAITYSWNVEETRVEDKYEIVTTVDFETRVPKPVVVVDFPKIPYRNHISYVSITNKGLVNATDITVLLPENDELMQFEIPGGNHIDLLRPEENVILPVIVSVDEDDAYPMPENMIAGVSSYTLAAESSDSKMMRSQRSSRPGCFEKEYVAKVHKVECDPVTGKDIGTGYDYVVSKQRYGNCGGKLTLPTSGADFSRFGGSIGGGVSGPSGKPGGAVNNPSPVTDTYLSNRLREILTTGCLNNCEKALAEAIKSCYAAVKKCSGSPGEFDIEGCVDGAIDNCLGKHPLSNVDDFIDCGDGLDGCYPPLGCPFAVAKCIRDAYKAFEECMKLKNQGKKSKALLRESHPDDMEAAARRAETVYITSEINSLIAERLINLLGSDKWDAVTPAEFNRLFSALKENRDKDNYVVSDEYLMSLRPLSVSTDDFRNFIDRVNNSLRYEREGISTANMIDYDVIEDQNGKIIEYNKRIEELGYADMRDFVKEASEEYANLIDMAEEPSDGLCAMITLQFRQEMVMTRQAFRGTLSIQNGNADIEMKDIRLSLKIKDQEGNIAGERKFDVSVESLKGFSGNMNLTDGWTLAPEAKGEATVLFIPSRYAAPEIPIIYGFGGTLSYIDPFTGMEVIRDLSPIDMTVNPSPSFTLDYFLQRDVIGDDPLTLNKVEVSEPAEFALIIRNNGCGDAINLKMLTNQPEIIDNSRGLNINFDFISSQLNGQGKVMAIGGGFPTSFGDLKAKNSAYAQWWIRSSLLGHFTSYDIKATQVSSYGSEDMSLLESVAIHELIHGFSPFLSANLVEDENSSSDITARAFLVNDIADSKGLPDRIFFSDNAMYAEVNQAISSLSVVDENNCILNVISSSAGWHYGSIDSPFSGNRKVVSIRRLSDNETIPADNFWLTFVTLKNSTNPIYEDKIHFIVNQNNNDSYLITFENRPDPELKAVIAGIPEDGKILLGSLEDVEVRFNKEIDSETFGCEDITLRCQGISLDSSQILIEKVNSELRSNDPTPCYKLNISKLTGVHGYYVLEIDPSGITDCDGFPGNEKSVGSWIQLADGKVGVTIIADPTQGGEVSPQSGRFEYGSTQLFRAAPWEGYEFIGWFEDNTLLDSEPEISIKLVSDIILTARFAKKSYLIEFSSDPIMGVITGASSGYYDFGSRISLKAIPEEGYYFLGWWNDSEFISSSSEWILSVNSDMNIVAKFSDSIISHVDKIDSEKSFIVYPNPTNGILYLKGCSGRIVEIIINSLDGSWVREIRGMEHSDKIDLHDLKKGIYLIRVITDTGFYTSRFIKE